MIPVYLQQFKAAGIYRVVFDQSTIINVDSQILRLVVGYSEKGPFNIPVYVTNASDFRMYFGDISKKLEKRGIFFHRLALQALNAGPILCLNLKKFENETVDGSTINTSFNPKHAIIEDVQLRVEDIYNTSRFWELDAEKLNNLTSVDGSVMDQYINICATNTKETSASYFIRKAAGSKVSQYNITVSDWYAGRTEDMPDFLENYQNSLISDFFAEIYVFGTKFNANQVLASSTLKKYFEVAVDANNEVLIDQESNEPVLKLANHITDAYGDWVDTLDSLYNDETSHALGHYVGCLIPEFKDKNGNYVSLNIVFNQEQSEHNMMMAFNTDLLYEDESASIDLSGRLGISSQEDNDKYLTVQKLFNNEGTSSLLGNSDAKIVTNRIKFVNNVVKFNEVEKKYEPIIPITQTTKKVMGTLYVSKFNPASESSNDALEIQLTQIGSEPGDQSTTITIQCESVEEAWKIGLKLHAAYETTNSEGAYWINFGTEDAPMHKYVKMYENGYGSVWSGYGSTSSVGKPYIDEDGEFVQAGPQKIITSIARLEFVNEQTYKDDDKNMKISVMDVVVTMENDEEDSVYGASVSFIPFNTQNQIWQETMRNGKHTWISDQIYENTLYSLLQVGDCLLAADGTNVDNPATYNDGFYDNVYVQEINCEYDEDGNIKNYYISFSGEPYTYDPITMSNDNSYLVRIDGAINREIGTMIPKYLTGYSYANPKPAGADMLSKLRWQEYILSTLTEYKGLRTGLLNKSDIDYRYIIDTFDSYVESSLKSTLSYLAKQKESAFAILNFPSVKTFTKCPYTSFTNADDVFDVKYVAAGYNKKKATAIKFSLPEDTEGASFCAFYTPLKFSDGYVDNIIPAAALVSNLFMQKYSSRQPYYIIAGPNYGRISANGLVGPDYNYSKEELYVMEPFGVNCMVYRPSFGTFINSNQTAKQTPVSALSKVNIRELVIYLQDEIEKVLQQYQWEFNNQTTRNAILDKANTICARIAANGGIEAYLNIMDETNNTPEIIENEMAILSTAIEPGFGCGKMVQELTLYRRGTISSKIKE